MSEKLSIQIIENGPIKVSGCSSLSYCGDELTAENDVYLCRCGESENAPFCDGTHSRCGFTGENKRSRQEDIITWEGETLRTFFNKNICMHVYYCQPLKALRERELAGDTSAADEIKQVIAECPSGALSYEDKVNGSVSAFESKDAIEIVEGGEIRIQSEFQCGEIDLAEKQASNRVTLCRCGLSNNKPFCDGRHKSKKGFK